LEGQAKLKNFGKGSDKITIENREIEFFESLSWGESQHKDLFEENTELVIWVKNGFVMKVFIKPS
jgi:hypothetical protein